MSSAEESPAQQAARLRRERREAKIKAGGSARLDKITSLSGRAPASERESASPSPAPRAPTPPIVLPSESPSETPRRSVSPFPPAPTGMGPEQSPESIQAQQEYLRALLRAHPPNQPQPPAEEDPTMKLLSSLMGGLPTGDDATSGTTPDISPADLSSALGVPPFLSKMLLGGAGAQAQTPAEQRWQWILKALHAVFAFALGAYLLLVIGSSVETYGIRPPPPATAQNPFVLFLTGELVLSGTRLLVRKRDGPLGGLGVGLDVLRDAVRDGSVALFVLGMGTWWYGGWQQIRQ
ncbi:conserved hypothetical protein [Paecilomyces variotii No. 5]|uniref:GET complex, subunit GET2 n=1 Tax=Byssochlamys spectabilis (strain No. 5 / NBRC 109023) TaxID=1356009 RepID=V5FC63_BYSSN|nr:conserved hypothetical protein [Paecilomyces variotii No. 5]